MKATAVSGKQQNMSEQLLGLLVFDTIAILLTEIGMSTQISSNQETPSLKDFNLFKINQHLHHYGSVAEVPVIETSLKSVFPLSALAPLAVFSK